MSNYISGSSSKIGAIKETTFNTTPSETKTALRMTSESLQATYNKLDEGVLMAAKTQVAQDLGSVSVSGDVDTVLNPSFADWLMETGLGVKTVNSSAVQPGSGATLEEVVYTLADVNADIPSSSLELWRGTEGFTYSGMTISQLSLEATAQDFVKANISFNGTKETKYTGASTIGAASTIGSYKCTKAKLLPNTAGSDDIEEWLTFSWDSCPTGQVYDVQTTTLTLDNGLEQTPATYCSGLYNNRPSHGQRSVTISCNVPYSTGFETFRQTYYANENAPNLALMLVFASKETVTYVPAGATSSVTEPAHQMFVILPNVSINNTSANASGQGIIDGSYSGIALSIGSTEPIKVIRRTYTAN